MDRRDFLEVSISGLAFLGVSAEPLFRISIAEWSFHRALFSGALTHLDFITGARRDYGLDAVEYVNQFFMDKAEDAAFLREMNSRTAGEGVRSLLIMCDSEGDLGDPSAGERARAVENHRKWVEAAATLGCHSVRVNARSHPDLPYEEQERLAADGLRSLCELADPYGIGVLVENHGGLSSNGTWLSGVMKRVAHPRIGTLPDFGNFRLRETPEEWYDRYQGVTELMPFARAVSAKSHDFDENGGEIHTDFLKMMRIVLDAGYRGYVGIEYEGESLSEAEGVEKTKALLVRVREELGRSYPPKALI
jgi:sugar phosphate isomerase/epimerase